jgi:hypothetical protein
MRCLLVRCIATSMGDIPSWALSKALKHRIGKSPPPTTVMRFLPRSPIFAEV